MTAVTTTTGITHATTAGYRIWVAEVIAQLLAVGLTQTADTGQINTASVNRPAVNTSGGYAIFRFNDTAHGTTPIFMRLEFGTGSVASYPMMWITVGQSTNGAGTITGSLIMTRVALFRDADPISLVTPMVSRFCYNATQGVLWMGWKYNYDGSTGGQTGGGFMIRRSTDAAGAPTPESFSLLSNSATDVGSAGNQGYIQVINPTLATVYNTAQFPTTYWGFQLFAVTGTLVGTDIQVLPAFQFAPLLGVAADWGLVFNAEFTVGSITASPIALVGATTHTFVSAGAFWGGSQIAQTGQTATAMGCLMLWE
jgi:hypothetical protein